MSRRSAAIIDEESWVDSGHGSSNRDSHPVANDGDNATNIALKEMVEAGLPELLYSDNGKNVLNLATLQRMYLFRHQTELIEKVTPLTKGQNCAGGKHPLDDPGLGTALTNYVQSVRDWESMVHHQRRAAEENREDPYLISGKYESVKKVMDGRGLAPATKREYGVGKLDEMIGVFNQRTRINKSLRIKGVRNRLILGIFGGVSLVGPMLLMVLHKDIVTATVTTSACVFAFAVIMSFRTEAAPEVIVGTVAAYAAVLVVFVGAIQQ